MALIHGMFPNLAARSRDPGEPRSMVVARTATRSPAVSPAQIGSMSRDSMDNAGYGRAKRATGFE
jgi:hypothetical protein